MIQTDKILLDFLRQKKKRRKAKQADESKQNKQMSAWQSSLNTARFFS